jgi:1-pyrroline-5-carboxylate dehydrogenase
MSNAIFQVPEPRNEPVLQYAPGSPERKGLKAKLAQLREGPIEVPVIIGGREVRTGRVVEMRAPHDHGLLLGRFHQAGPEEVQAAAQAAARARKGWAAMAWHDRLAIFLKAAELLAGPWRASLNAATMLGQSKTVYQAEIDSAAEIIDFWRFNPSFAARIFEDQPLSVAPRWNRVEYRPLEGFVFAVTPFNFTSIAANLPTAPAMLGNTVLWKPASSAVYSAFQLYKLLEAAGLPPGVINFVPGPGRAVGDPALAHPDFAGLHFTGSTPVFHAMWRSIGANLARYRSYPRIVGETGGKDFVFAHPSADPEALSVALVRGAFEYQGQKCSAASRAYLPESLWPELQERLTALLAEVRMGDVEDFTCFMGAVIDRDAYQRIRNELDLADASPDCTLLHGGRCDDSQGFFIEPTLVQTTDPRSRLMQEEIFGPVLTVFVYPDAKLDEALALCESTSPYGLTGAIFARDRQAIAAMTLALRDAAGSLYINDKPTGAVVGQQPFGGARASGTNDKAGSLANLLRWVSMRTLSENFVPPTRFEYLHMAER